LASAGSISQDSIEQFDDTQFHVTSASCPGGFFAIDLARQHCNCKDFHRIEFCKHLAAIQAHFPHLHSEGNTEVTDLAQEPYTVSNPGHLRLAHDLGTLLQQVSALSQKLAGQPITQSDYSPAVVEAYRTLKYSLMATLASRQGMSALPNKESIPPNQRTWPEMAEQMGIWHMHARKQPPLTDSAKVCRINECCISATTRRKCKNEDPYSGEDQGGKCTQPDALSPEANDCARASQPRTATPAFPQLVPGAAFYTFPPPPPPAHFPSLS
jgi:hypothetical protein